MQIRGVNFLRKTSHSSLLCYLKHPICAGVEAVWVLVRRCHLLKPRTFWSCFKPRIHHRLPLTRGNCLDQRSSRDIWDIRIFGIFVIFLENFCRCGARPSISCLLHSLSVTSCETTLPLPPKKLFKLYSRPTTRLPLLLCCVTKNVSLRYIVFNVPVHASATLSFVNHWFELSSILSQVSNGKIIFGKVT